MATTSSTALRELLVGAGYEVIVRDGVDVECFIHRGAERWVGRGESEQSALDDAIARMLPSHVARELLVKALAAAAARPPAPAVRSAPERRAPAPRPPPPPLPPGVPATRELAAAALDELLAEIEAVLPSFARTAPDRQRTMMLAWICRARRIEESYPGEHDMERRASAIARRLSDLAKTFWPGSVRALQLGARPGDVPELRTRGLPTPKTWADAVPVAEKLLEAQIAESKAEGLDAEGWLPASTEPTIKGSVEKTFTEASNALDALTAELPRSGKSVVADGPAIDKLVVIAKKLRWTRSRVKDAVAWGAAVGRLRKLIPALKTGGTRIREVIDPKQRLEPW
jgi:hypothetical protein